MYTSLSDSSTTQRAFSLAELSIVLVILGLLTGGILAGQSLIRASELRSITSDIESYRTAIIAFNEKYFYLPGDLPNATDFWGAEDGGDGLGTDCTETQSTNEATCNGDGNGQVAGPSGAEYEELRFWQHLANAGLIIGTFDGVGPEISDGGGSRHRGCSIGINCPEMELPRSTVKYAYFDGLSNAWYHESGLNGNHVFVYGAEDPSDHDGDGRYQNPHRPILTTEEAWGIDKKIDDGKPAYGFVTTYRKGETVWWVTEANDCANNATATSAEYDFTLTGVECALVFR